MINLTKNRVVLWVFFVLCVGGVLFLLYGQGESAMKNKTETTIVPTPKPLIDVAVPARIETATFALGCFWGPDSLFGSLPGVVRTRVGYAGGTKENPTYH